MGRNRRKGGTGAVSDVTTSAPAVPSTAEEVPAPTPKSEKRGDEPWRVFGTNDPFGAVTISTRLKDGRIVTFRPVFDFTRPNASTGMRGIIVPGRFELVWNAEPDPKPKPRNERRLYDRRLPQLKTFPVTVGERDSAFNWDTGFNPDRMIEIAEGLTNTLLENNYM